MHAVPHISVYHWAEVKLKMWTMNLGKPMSIPKLNENMAIDLGAELVGEGIIFSIAAGKTKQQQVLLLLFSKQ
jgi:hypothetical protein